MNQMLKKASSVFTAVVCAASITFSGASLVMADSEIDDQTKTTIETTAEGLTDTIIPLTDEEIAAYQESGDAFTESAMTAWDNAEIGMMDASLAAKIMYPGEDAAVLNEKAAAYRALQSNVESAAARGYVDTVIAPADTRKYVIGAFEMLFTKREDRPSKKHGTV